MFDRFRNRPRRYKPPRARSSDDSDGGCIVGAIEEMLGFTVLIVSVFISR